MKFFPSALAASITGVLVFIVQEVRIQSLQEQIGLADQITRQDQKSGRNGDLRSNGKITRTPGRSKSRSVSPRKPKAPRSMNEVMQSDEGRALIKEGIKTGLPTLYGDFIDYLNLSDGETQYFNELLSERLLHQQQSIFKWMQASEDVRQDIEQDMESARAQNTHEIEQFLQNDQDAAAFQKYEQQLQERQQMRKIRSALSTEQLKPNIEEELVELLYQARLNSGEGDGSDEENWLALSNGSDFSSIEKRWQETDSRIAQSIPDLLTPAQSKIFLSQWEISRNQKVAEYQMGMLMFELEKE